MYDYEHFCVAMTTTHTRPPVPKLNIKKKVKDTFYVKDQNVSSEYVSMPDGFATGRQRACVPAAQLAAPRSYHNCAPENPTLNAKQNAALVQEFEYKHDGDERERRSKCGSCDVGLCDVDAACRKRKSSDACAQVGSLVVHELAQLVRDAPRAVATESRAPRTGGERACAGVG